MCRHTKTIFLLLLLLICLLSLGSCQRGDSAARVRFYFLDVGQGDALLIRTPEGDVLVDAGDESAQELLCLRLEQLGVKSLRLAVFTHPDEDHIGGADGILSRFQTDEIWISGAPMENEAARRLLEEANARQTAITVVQGREVQPIGGAYFAVLAPIGDVSEGGNESSIVLRVQFGERVAILTGDADSKGEEMLVERYGRSQLACDLYKVGHHGSNTSSSVAFLRTMRPTYAVISCGASNSYGHPTGEVLAKLRDEGITVLRTDRCGEIVFETDGDYLRYLGE